MKNTFRLIITLHFTKLGISIAVLRFKVLDIWICWIQKFNSIEHLWDILITHAAYHSRIVLQIDLVRWNNACLVRGFCFRF